MTKDSSESYHLDFVVVVLTLGASEGEHCPRVSRPTAHADRQ